MPDTGAPWNIPYVAGTDLVSDWPTDNQTLAEAIADALDIAAFSPINAQSTSTFTTTSSSFTLVTGLEVDVTPSAVSSDVLVVAFLPRCAISATGNVQGRIYRDGTGIGPTGQSEIYTGTAANGFAISWVDSPATTSLVNYELRVKRAGSGTASIYGGSIFAQELR